MGSTILQRIRHATGPGDIVLGGDPAPPRKGHSRPYFSTHAYSGQTAGWISIPLGTKVGLDQSDIVLDRDIAPHGKGHSSPHFSVHVYCGQTIAHLSNF